MMLLTRVILGVFFLLIFVTCVSLFLEAMLKGLHPAEVVGWLAASILAIVATLGMMPERGSDDDS